MSFTVNNKSPICEICGKHAEAIPLGCKHYPNIPDSVAQE